MSAVATQTEVRERPIIFSGPMVRAILEGRKTQTRRVVKGLPPGIITAGGIPEGDYQWRFTDFKTHVDRRCPYGRPQLPLEPPNSRLWVREAFVLEQQVEGNEPPHTDARPVMHNNDMEAEWHWLQPHYRATDPVPDLTCDREDDKACDGGAPCCHWKPSIFMPRWASRITLEIKSIRVERLQEISEADAIAEGIRPMRDGSGVYVGREGPRNLVTPWPTAKEAFADGWDSINAKRKGCAWTDNPWVWVVEFVKL